MLLFWLMCGALAAAVAAAILRPFWRGHGAAPEDAPAAAYDLRVYRDQLREVGRDADRGIIAPEDAERLRTEIGRKVLDADRRMAAETGGARGRGGLIGAGLAAALAVGGAFALYGREGAPGLRDLPLAARLAEARRVSAGRPSQAELERAAPAPAPAITPADPEYAALLDQLRKAVQRNPDDPQGLTLLARSEARLGNIAAARAAQAHLVELRGENASAAELTELAALMVQSAGGVISPEAGALLDRAVQRDPANPQARYVLGLLHAQNGRPDLTFRLWSRLLEEGPPDAPWMGPIRESIASLAWVAGQPDYVPPEDPTAPPLPGPDADAVAAASGMSEGDRGQMIAGMVQRLEERLATEGGTAEEWARLITSLSVMGNRGHAAEILAEARRRFAADPRSAPVIEQAAATAGLAE